MGFLSVAYSQRERKKKPSHDLELTFSCEALTNLEPVVATQRTEASAQRQVQQLIRNSRRVLHALIPPKPLHRGRKTSLMLDMNGTVILMLRDERPLFQRQCMPLFGRGSMRTHVLPFVMFRNSCRRRTSETFTVSVFLVVLAAHNLRRIWFQPQMCVHCATHASSKKDQNQKSRRIAEPNVRY